MSRPNEKLRGAQQPTPTLDRRFAGWLVPALMAWFFITAIAGPLAALAKGTPVSTAPAGTATQPSESVIVATELVVKIAGQSDAETRRQAAITILKTGSSEGGKVLLPLLQTKNNEEAKLAVCEAIAEVKVQDPVFIPHLLSLLNEQSPPLQEAAATALGVYDDPAVVDKLRSYRAHQYDQQLIKSLTFHLKLLYERTTETDRPKLLISWLKSGLVDERLIALGIIYEAMGKGTQPVNGILQQIRSMLNDPDDATRVKLIEIMRDLRDKKDAPQVRDMLAQKQSAGVREAIYKTLGMLEDPDSIPTCIKGLNDAVPEVAAGAATALGLLLNSKPDPKLLDAAVEALLAKTKTPIANDVLRESVIGAMAKIAQPKFLETLRAHAGATEQTASIRQAAIRGIGAIGDPSQINLGLERLTEDTDPNVREAAAEAVGKLGSSADHLRLLRSRLDSKVETSAAVRNAAWEAYRLIFNRLEINEQQLLIESWVVSDATSVERRVELLSDLEKKISASSGGDQAKQTWVTEKLIEGYLQSTTPEKAIDLAAKVKLASVREVAAGSLLGYVQKISQTDTRAAGEFVEKLKKAVPDLFGAQWAKKFAQTQPAATQSTQPAK